MDLRDAVGINDEAIWDSIPEDHLTDWRDDNEMVTTHYVREPDPWPWPTERFMRGLCINCDFDDGPGYIKDVIFFKKCVATIGERFHDQRGAYRNSGEYLSKATMLARARVAVKHLVEQFKTGSLLPHDLLDQVDVKEWEDQRGVTFNIPTALYADDTMILAVSNAQRLARSQ
jgi:hypothetical protein